MPITIRASSTSLTDIFHQILKDRKETLQIQREKILRENSRGKEITKTRKNINKKEQTEGIRRSKGMSTPHRKR